MLVALLLAAALAPLSFHQTTKDAELSLTIDPAARHAPVLADRLYRGEVKALKAFGAEAVKGRREEPKAFRDHGAWEMAVTYDLALETPRLLSLTREGYEDSHGAHPNHFFGGVVFDKPTNRNLHPLDLLRPGADLPALDSALCDAARAAKRERAEGDWNEKEDSNFHCPTWRGIPFEKGKMFEGSAPPQIALAKGTVRGKAGGLTFLYSPYDLGAYVEGPYEITLPAAVLIPQLRPEIAAEFAGRPLPPPKSER